MLDFLNLKKRGNNCELCRGSIKNEICSPKECSHLFHRMCLENWALDNATESDYICPVEGCLSKFTDIIIRKTSGSISSKTISLKESHQCPICCELIQKPVATPESCNHSFCYICLKEWSRIRHECPLDRGSFELILLSDRVGGPITQRVSAPPVKHQPSDTPPLELEVNCEVCQNSDNEACLLLCDNCDRGYHTYCLPVPLTSVPQGDWFCPHCENDQSSNQRSRFRGNTATSFEDLEAEESDGNNYHSSLDGSVSEDMSFLGELSPNAQHRLHQLAVRRHRGSRLLQELVSNLSERITIEVANRQRNRLNRRRCVRSQARSNAISQSNDSNNNGLSQTTLLFDIHSNNDQPVQLRLNTVSTTAASAVGNRTENSNAATRTVQTRQARSSQGARRRVRLLSNSNSSDDDSPVGIIRTRRKRLVRPSSGSDSDDLSRPRNKNKNPRFIDDEDDNQDIHSAVSRCGISNPPVPSTSSTAFNCNDTCSELESLGDPISDPNDSTFVITTSKRTKKPAVRRKKKRKRTSTKTPSAKKKSAKRIKRKLSSSLTRRRRKTKLKKIRLTKKKTKLNKSVGGATPNKSSSSFSSQHSLSRTKSALSSLPRLSVLGSELSCDFRMRLSDDEHDVGVYSHLSKPGPSTSKRESNSQEHNAHPKPSSYLRDIEANQASMFQFTTRHMQVNSDHSMCPIPVNQPAAPTCKLEKSQPNHERLLTSKSTTVKNESVGTHKPSTSNGYSDNHVEDDLRVEMHADPKLGWHCDNKQHICVLVRQYLKVYLNKQTISKNMFQDIYKRCLDKIFRKPACKVTDDRVKKLVDDYVQYCLKH